MRRGSYGSYGSCGCEGLRDRPCLAGRRALILVLIRACDDTQALWTGMDLVSEEFGFLIAYPKGDPRTFCCGNACFCSDENSTSRGRTLIRAIRA